MKYIILSAAILTVISNFAADPQDNHQRSAQTFSFPENTQSTGLFSWMLNAPNAVMRHVDTYTNQQTQKEMFGLDGHEGEEYQRSLSCYTYFEEIALTVPLKIAVDPEMKSRCDKRRHIYPILAIGILTQQKQNEIGDLQSLSTIKRIDKLLTFSKVFGSENLSAMLLKHKEFITTKLAESIEPKKLSSSQQKNNTQSPTGLQPTLPINQQSKPAPAPNQGTTPNQEDITIQQPTHPGSQQNGDTHASNSSVSGPTQRANLAGANGVQDLTGQPAATPPPTNISLTPKFTHKKNDNH